MEWIGRDSREAMLKWQPRYLCFNGKRAGKEYFDVGAIEYGSSPLDSTQISPTSEGRQTVWPAC